MQDSLKHFIWDLGHCQKAFTVHSGCRSVLNGLQTYVQTRMEQMAVFVADAASSQAQHLAVVSADVAAFKAKKDGDLAVLLTQVRTTTSSGASGTASLPLLKPPLAMLGER